MQKASVTSVIGIIVAVAAIVAAEYYFFEYRPRVAEAELYGSDYGAGLPEVSNLGGDDDAQIIECEDPDIGIFYTNEDSCEDAEPPKTQ